MSYAIYNLTPLLNIILISLITFIFSENYLGKKQMFKTELYSITNHECMPCQQSTLISQTDPFQSPAQQQQSLYISQSTFESVIIIIILNQYI